jgi:carboxymethylenebutenolidase
VKLLTFLVSLLLIACTGAQAQDWAKEKLDKSPRHLDWVTVKNGEREIKCFIAYPEVKHKAPAVLVIHEIFGLTDWARDVCDQLAAHGYIAIAPDLMSGKMDAQTSQKASIDDLRKIVSALPAQQITEDLSAAADYVTHLPSCDHKLSVVGFCWGGGQAFRYATNNPELKAAFVFYGSPPDNAADMARIKAPVYGFYGENDARITSTVEVTSKLMKESGKKYSPTTYAGAGHGFMRTGEAPDANDANKKARTEGWARLEGELHKL